jgi:hypothetical protein
MAGTSSGRRAPVRRDSSQEGLHTTLTEKRRSILFCSCLEATLREDDGLPGCHRVPVTGLLWKAVRRRGLWLEVVQWPGGAPKTVELLGTPALAKAVKAGTRYPSDRAHERAGSRGGDAAMGFAGAG